MLISYAAAEAAAASTPSTSLDLIQMVFIALGVFMLVSGLACLVTGKVYGMGKSAAAFTEESLKNYARPYGISNLLIGIGLIADELFDKTIAFTVGSVQVPVGLLLLLGFGVAALLIYIPASKKLVRKPH